MDKTKRYRQMADCPEIQGVRPIPEMFEDWNMLVYYTGGLLIDNRGNWWAEKPKLDAIWLPLQDQLQEMVIDGRDTEKLLWAFARFVFVYDGDTFKLEGRPRRVLNNTFPSMEQLWLAFVMKEKYGKVWDREKWNG